MSKILSKIYNNINISMFIQVRKEQPNKNLSRIYKNK